MRTLEEFNRGQLTVEIKKFSTMCFDYEITQEELNLIFYIFYQSVNCRGEIDYKKINKKEEEILNKWDKKGFIIKSKVAKRFFIGKVFWNRVSQFIWDGYVENKIHQGVERKNYEQFK